MQVEQTFNSQTNKDDTQPSKDHNESTQSKNIFVTQGLVFISLLINYIDIYF